MAKNIKVGIKLPSNNQLKTEIQSAIKLMEKYATLDFKIDTKEFTKSLSSMSNELNKLKTQLSKFNILENVSYDTSKITKTKKDIDDLANSMSKLDKLKFNLQNKLNTASSNNFIDESVITKLQNRLDSINSNVAEREILELKNAINNLSSSDSNIVRLQNSITKLQERIANIKKNNIDIINTSEINELKQAENELLKLKEILNSVKTGEVIDSKAISNQINIATNSVRSLENEFKSVDNTASGLSNTMKNIFSYALGGSAFYTAMNAMREAVDTTIELDTAMRDLKRVTDETQNTYSNFTKTANQTAIELGTTTVGAIEATTTFSQLGYSFKQASEELSKYALILSNVGDMSAEDASKSIVSVLKGFKLEASETKRIIDVLNEAGNRFALSTNSMAEGLRVGAADLSIAGNDLEQASAMIIAGTEVLQDSNVVSTGLKTIGMRLRGVSQDGEELNASLGELVKTLTGVDLTDANGEFRSTYDILVDISKVFNTLSSQEQALLLEEVAGKNRANVLAAILQNAEALTEAYDVLKDSSGSALAEQESYVNSLSGKINALKESLTGLSIQMVDSDFLKGTIDVMTSGVNVVGEFIDTFGAMPTAITGTVGALTIFNSKFRETTNNMLLAIPGYGNLTTAMSGFEKSLKSNIEGIQKQIVELKKQQTQSLATGDSTSVLGVKMIGLNSKLALTTAGLVATKVATIALQAAMSMGLSLAISGIISLLTSMCQGLFDTEGRIEAVNEASKNLGDTLESTTDVKTDLSSYEELRKKLDDISLSEEERKSLNEQLEEVKSRLYSADDQAYAIINNQNLSLERQLELLESINKEKLRESAEELEDKMTGGFWGEDESKRVDRLKEIAEYSSEAYQELSKLQKQYNGETFEFKGLTLNLEQQNEMLETYKKQMQEGADAVDKYNSNVELLNKAGVDTERTTKSLSDQFKDFYSSITETTKALDDNTRAKEENANAGGDGNTIDSSSIQEATKTYGEAVDKVQELDSMLQKINEAQALTPDIVSELAKNYSELGARITSVSDVQQFLSDKIQEQVAIQEEAYQIMIGDDVEYYNARIKNSENAQIAFDEFASRFVDVNGENYDIDLDNFTTLNEAKGELINQLSEPLGQFLANLIGGSAEGYAQELRNTRSYAEAKALILRKLTEQVAKVENQITKLMASSQAMKYVHPDAAWEEYIQIDALNKQLDNLKAQKADIETSFNEFYASFNTSTPTFGKGSSSIGSSSSSNKGSSSKDTEKQVADLEDLTDRYYDLENAIKDYSNALSFNKLLQNNADDKEKINLMKQEIELYKKQADAVKKLNDEQKREASELKSYLSKQGVTFDSSGDISNYNSVMSSWVNWANSLSGEAKENAINSTKALEESLKRYDELVNNLIPKQEQEWQNLANTIKDVYKQQAEAIADQEKQIYDTIKYYAEKATETKKKEIEKQINLLNKSYEEEDDEENLNKQRQKVTELLNEMAKYENSVDARSKKKYQELLAEYEEQQAELNNMIKEAQKESMLESMELEKEKLDEDLEDLLSPANMNKLIADALSSGMVEIGGEVVDLQKAMTSMLEETTIGTQTLIQTNNEWINSLKEAMSLYSNISNINSNIGLNTSIDGLSNARNVDSRVFNVNVNVPEMANGVTADDVSKAITKALKKYDSNFK